MFHLQLFELLNLEFFYTTCSSVLASQDELKVKCLYCRAGCRRALGSVSPAAPQLTSMAESFPRGADAELPGPGDRDMNPAGHSWIKTTPP